LPKYIKKLTAALLIAATFLLLGFEDSLGAYHNNRDILVLNSYHSGYKWTDDIVGGIISVLGSNSEFTSNTQIEYMDAKRISDEEYLNKLFELYQYKFKDQKIDLIICSDDSAFNFLLNYHQQLFPNVPIVFSGVNYFDDGTIAGKSEFTGVVEVIDARTTLKTMLDIHPDTKQIYMINGKSKTGEGTKKKFQEAIMEFSWIKFYYLEDLSLEEVQARVQNLPAQSLVLLLDVSQDAVGKATALEESITTLSSKSNSPIYGLWDFYLGKGIVGGRLISGSNQGEMAAHLALRVLRGEKPADIPVVRDNPSYYMFDSLQLKRFGIDNTRLPDNSTIVNLNYSDKKQILVLNSYDATFDWVNNIEAGLLSVFHGDESVKFYFDYMDANRNPQIEYTQSAYRFFREKYTNKRYDAIIVADDPAFKFMLSNHQDLFPDTPIIFCGVNESSGEEIYGLNSITGVFEDVDFKGTIDGALQLQPDLKHIVVINDKTPSGKAGRKKLEEIIPQFEDRVHFAFIDYMNMSDLQQTVARLDSDTAILLLSFNQDNSNAIFSYEESIELIAKNSAVPIYGVWDFYLRHGLLGGMLTSGYSQGAEAGKMLQRILKGEKALNIPVLKQSPNQYIFDHEQLAKYKISSRNLPSGSIIVNQPISFYETYKNLVWGVGIFILILILIILVLYILVLEKRKTEERLRIFAATDPLTGLLNRRSGLEFLRNQMVFAQMNNRKLTISFIDVNGLKKVNDQFGHQAGDQLIQAVGEVIQSTIRDTDRLCRFGGDEFLLVMPNADIKEADALYERMQRNFCSYNDLQLYPFNVSVSCGSAQFDPSKPISKDELIKIADEKMYSEKSLSKEA